MSEGIPVAGWAQRLMNRVNFAIKHRTFEPIVPAGDRLAVCGPAGSITVPKHCPHQGAPLWRSRIESGHLVCRWHACKYRLSDGKFIVAKGLKVMEIEDSQSRGHSNDARS